LVSDAKTSTFGRNLRYFAQMRLQPGSPAPVFKKNDLRGDVLDLEEMLKHKPVWLGFFRFAMCPLCNLRVHQMVGEWKRFEPLCSFIAVFQSPSNAFEGFITKHTPPFYVVADPELAMFTPYALENSLLKAVFHPKGMVDGLKASKAGFSGSPSDPKHGAALRIPGDFIIGRDGTLRVARYGSFVSDSIPFDEAEAALKAV
jgi:thioredoxin-dependent peroxiredoxin